MRGDPIGSVEEAVNLLRRQEATVWMQYLLGAAPLLLMLTWFVHDMSAGYFASRCAPEALLCTLVFFWSSVWKARFGGALLAGMRMTPGNGPTAGFWRVLYLQSVVQTMKLVTLPLAIVSVLPAVWTANFFRHAAIEANEPNAGLRTVLAASARRASRHGRDNWLSMAILAAVYFLVLANTAALVMGLPWLVRTLTGSENLWTRHPQSLFSADIVCAVLAIAWLAMDPLFAACAAVQAFRVDAQTDGRDLLAKLRVAAVLALVIASAPARAETSVSGTQIAKAIQQAAQSDDYGWLRADDEKRHSGPAEAFLKRLKEDLAAINRHINRAASAFGRWLRSLFKRTPLKDTAPSLNGAAPDVHLLMYGLALLVVLAGVFFLVRRLRRPAPVPAVVVGSSPAPDLSQDNLQALDLPEDEWRQLAQELRSKGEPRLALRALYLANLAYLGSARLIRIAKAKSNYTYERELRLLPTVREACAPFARANRKFERAWYGFDEVTPDFLADFQQDAEALRRHAKA